MQVLCGLQGIFLIFNCQTPDPLPEGVDYPEGIRKFEDEIQQ